MPGSSIPVVMYHHISPMGGGLNISPEIFKNHLTMLYRKGWKTLSGEEFLYFFQNNEIPKKWLLNRLNIYSSVLFSKVYLGVRTGL